MVAQQLKLVHRVNIKTNILAQWKQIKFLYEQKTKSEILERLIFFMSSLYKVSSLTFLTETLY